MSDLSIILSVAALSAGSLWAFYSSWVTAWSHVSAFMPPPEMFDDYPRFQKPYRLFGKLAKWFSLDVRTKVYPSIIQTQLEQARKTLTGEMRSPLAK